MSTQGSNSPGTCADDASTGTVAWSNPNNAKVSDNVYTTAVVNNSTSHWLKTTNFGFSVPTSAVILGIQVEAEAKISSSGWVLDYVRIVKGGSIGTENKTLGEYTTTDSYCSIGGSNDLWGESWTASDINSSNFGVAISTFVDTSSDYTVSIDHVRVTVYYTDPGVGNLLSQKLPIA